LEESKWILTSSVPLHIFQLAEAFRPEKSIIIPKSEELGGRKNNCPPAAEK